MPCHRKWLFSGQSEIGPPCAIPSRRPPCQLTGGPVHVWGRGAPLQRGERPPVRRHLPLPAAHLQEPGGPRGEPRRAGQHCHRGDRGRWGGEAQVLRRVHRGRAAQGPPGQTRALLLRAVAGRGPEARQSARGGGDEPLRQGRPCPGPASQPAGQSGGRPPGHPAGEAGEADRGAAGPASRRARGEGGAGPPPGRAPPRPRKGPAPCPRVPGREHPLRASGMRAGARARPRTGTTARVRG